jgi:exodeoxyribonuclease V alpha subunit
MRSDLLATLAASGNFSPLNLQAARFLAELDGAAPLELVLAAALVSRQVEEGHVCLDLAEIAARPLPGLAGPALVSPELGAWVRALRASPVVGAPGEFKPLVLDGSGRLYLYRYWAYEQALSSYLLERAREPLAPLEGERLREGLASLFPAPPTDWQRVAALLALLRPLTVISGGPGTGKTSTVVKILALLSEQSRGGKPRIALGAPTGKAAARLKDSVRTAKSALASSPERLEAIPEDVSTLHRLLGARPGSSRFRHDAGNPLPLDVLVVDEASMVDLPLMAKLVTALPRRARLILLGDRDQLASVEAGAVLGDLCGSSRAEPFSPSLAAAVGSLAGDRLPVDPEAQPGSLSDSVVLLQRNYRFGEQSPIGKLSRAIYRGESDAALDGLRSGEGGLAWVPLGERGGTLRELAKRVVRGCELLVRAERPDQALEALGRFQVLCALRRGKWGAEEVNAFAERELASAGLLRAVPRRAGEERWYPGRPVMVTANDYVLRLFNGDVGVALPDPGAGGDLRVFFPAPEGGLRSLPPARLPAHETAYALTVHKSQGSEFDEVLLLLGDRPAPVLTRELLYTGVTRARRRVEVWGTDGVFREAVARRVKRSSGLRDALWGSAGSEGRRTRGP